MIAFVFAFLIVVFLGLVGLGVASIFWRSISLAILLVAPCIGLGVVLPIELSFNRAGLPVEAFGQWLVLGLALFSFAILFIRRPTIPWSEIRPLIPAWLVAGLLAGGPMIAFGFNWAGNSNGDGTMYMGVAANFLHHGLFDIASLSQLIRGTDTSRDLWFYEILPPNRYGTDALLALAAAATHRYTYEVYMPCSVAAFVALVMATGALCANRVMRPRLVPATILIAAASPLLLFTVYQQLLPQLLGQLALVSVVALVQTGDFGRLSLVQRSLALGCCAVAFAFVYPEISPLLLVAAGVTAPVALWRNRKELVPYGKRIAFVLLIGAVVFIALENVQVFTFAATMRILLRIVSNSVGNGVGDITYYMVPSGLSNLWGLTPFESYGEPWLSISIIIGGLAFVGVAAVATRSLFKHAKLSDGMLLALQLEFTVMLLQRTGYVAFKTAFILQPFFAPAVALAILWASARLSRRWRVQPRLIRAGFITACIAATAYSTYVYLGATSDLFLHDRSQFVEVSGASSGKLYGDLDSIAKRYRNEMSRPIRMDGLVWQLDLFAGMALRGHPLEFEGADPFPQYFLSNTGKMVKDITGWPSGVRSSGRAIGNLRARLFENRQIALPPAMTSTNFDVLDSATGTSTRNLAPDSDDFSAGWNAWSPKKVTTFHVDGVGPANNHGGWQTTGDGGPSNAGTISDAIRVEPGSVITVSVWVDPRGSTGPFNGSIYINNDNPGRNLARSVFHGTQPGRISVTYAIPSGVTSIRLLFTNDGSTLRRGAVFTWAMPMLEVGRRAGAYVPSGPYFGFHLHKGSPKTFISPTTPNEHFGNLGDRARRLDGLFFEGGGNLSLLNTSNLAPDSDYFSAGWSAWSPIKVTTFHVDGVGPGNNHGGWQTTGEGGPSDAGTISSAIRVEPGTVIIVSVWIDPRGSTGPFNSSIYINNDNPNGALTRAVFHSTRPGRVFVKYAVPSGVTSIRLLFTNDGATLRRGAVFTWAMPMLEVSNRASAYVPSGPFTGFDLYRRSAKAFVAPEKPDEREYFGNPGKRSPGGDGLFLEVGPNLSLLNRSQLGAPFHVRVVPWNSVRNWLSFVESDFGTPATMLVDRYTAAMGDVEPDPANPPNFMATLGKSMLLEVINGPPTVRLELALTATFNPRPYTEIPPIAIVGTSVIPIPSIGSGSARILTPPVRPFTAFGRRYLILYIGDNLVKFTARRTWLMNLFGRDIDLDARRFVLYGRDISIVRSLPIPPKQIARFPMDLMNPALLYSGIFEDGWLGSQFSVWLRSSGLSDVLRVRLNVPPSSARQTVLVKVDGEIAARINVAPGTYVDVALPGADKGNHLITVQASAVGRHVLTADSRPTWARLQEIGFVSVVSPSARSAESAHRLGNRSSHRAIF